MSGLRIVDVARVVPLSSFSFLQDRIQVSSLLIVASFTAVLGLSSQSAASWPTYLLGILTAASFRRWDDVLQIRYLWLILALVLYLVSSSLWSVPFAWEDVARISLRGLLILLFVIACAECQWRGQLEKWLGRSLAIVASFVAVIAMFVHLIYPDYHPGDRLYGLGQLDNPVIAGLIFGAAAIVMLDLVYNEGSSRWKTVGVGCSLILIVAIFLTGSRSAWFSVAFGALVFVCSNVTTDVRKFSATVLTLGLVIGVAIVVLATGDSTQDLLLPRGSSYRLDIWMEIIEKVRSEGLIFGLGISAPDEVAAAGHSFQHPHSLYVSVFFQGGIIGFLLLLSLIAWTIRNLLVHYDKRNAKLAMGLFGIALSGYFLDGHELIDKVSDMWFLFWLPIALTLGLVWRAPSPDIA